MPLFQQFSSAPNFFVPAELQYHKNGNGWQIVYYVYNPVSDKMEKKRIRMNMLYKKLHNRTEFRRRCNDIICDINIRLKSGWTPYGESVNSRYYEYVTDVLQKFLDEKSDELRKDSLRSYKSFVKQLSAYIDKNLPKCKCQLFTHYHAVCFMDFLYSQKKRDGSRRLSANSYNNYVKLGRSIFGWFVEKSYLKENPFLGFKKKQTDGKYRDIIPKEDRDVIRKWFSENSPMMLIVCQLVYFSLLRPKEIERLQFGDIDLQNKRILLPGSKTKNHKSRQAPLSDELVLLLTHYCSNRKCSDFIFTKSGSYVKMWERMRQETGLPNKYQLFSSRYWHK